MNMRVRYVGTSFGIDGLTDQNEYEVIAYESDVGGLRIIDDSGEDYLYSPKHPKPLAAQNHPGGHFEIVEDDENNTLHKAIYG